MLKLVSLYVIVFAFHTYFSVGRISSYILSILNQSYIHLKVTFKHGDSNYSEVSLLCLKCTSVLKTDNFFLEAQQEYHDNVMENFRG